MKSFKAACALLPALIALGGLATAARSEAQNPGGGDLLKRMVQVNAKLKSYTADVHLDAKLKTFPFFSPSLSGKVYFKAPDKRAIVFDTVPALASQFKKVYPNLDPPAVWEKTYDVTPIADRDGTTTFRLIPKKNGRVEHLDVNVDDAKATIKGYAWTYKDGGSISFDQTMLTVDGNYLPDKVSGKVDLPSYKADVSTEFSGYKLNVPVDESVFDEK